MLRGGGAGYRAARGRFVEVLRFAGRARVARLAFSFGGAAVFRRVYVVQPASRSRGPTIMPVRCM